MRDSPDRPSTASTVQSDEPGCNEFSGDPEQTLEGDCLVVIDRGDAAAYLGTLVLLATGVSALSFRRRDVS